MLTECLALQLEEADAVVLHSSVLIAAGKCGLVPVMTEYYDKGRCLCMLFIKCPASVPPSPNLILIFEQITMDSQMKVPSLSSAWKSCGGYPHFPMDFHHLSCLYNTMVQWYQGFAQRKCHCTVT